MDGIKTRGMTLYLTQMPNRKGLTFCFEDNGVLYPVAYVSEKLRQTAIDKWTKMMKGV